jgi:hypothetical protein
METITNYEILTDTVVADLETAVISAIASGWKPVGGIVYDGATNYYQSMIKSTPLVVTDYKMIHNNDADSFATAVKAAIADGWYLYGSQQGTGSGGFQQAFIKI